MKIKKRLSVLTVLLASLALAPFPLWSQIGSEAGKAQKQTGAGGAGGSAGADGAAGVEAR